MQPQLPIDVDAQTGVWTTDALPMRSTVTRPDMSIEVTRL